MQHQVGLLIIDMLNDMAFPDGEKLAKRSLPVAKKIAALKARARKQKIPVIYVNDNCGEWKFSWQDIYEKSIRPSSRGRHCARLLPPEPEDYFVVKARHSGFYSSNLEALLEDLGIRNLILTGVSGDMCVLFTAMDAYVRKYKLWVPQDCIASLKDSDHHYSLAQIKKVTKARLQKSSSLDLSSLS